MKINSKDFRVREAHEVDLRKLPTNVEPVYKSKEHYHKLLADHVAQLSSLQQLLYAPTAIRGVNMRKREELYVLRASQQRVSPKPPFI